MQNPEVITLLKDAFELKRQMKYKRAMELLYKALAICPDNVEILTQVAELHMQLKNITSACSILERILEKEPNNVLVFGNLVEYYVSGFSYEKAKVMLSKFILAYPSLNAYEIYVKNFVAMKNYEEVIEFYNDKNLKESNSDCINKYYAIALCNLNRFDEAKAVYEHIFANKYEDEETKYYYAKTLSAMGYNKEAYSIALALVKETSSPDVYNLVGELEIDIKNYEKAIEHLSKAVKIEPNGLYFYNLGTAYFLNGQLKEAKLFYTKAVASSSQTLEYRYALAYLYYKQQNFVKAKQILEYILSFDASFKEAIFLKATILYDESHYFQAREVLLSSKNLYDENDAEYAHLSFKIAKALGQSDLALDIAMNLVHLEPESVNYNLELAYLYYEKGEYSSALQTVENVIMKEPSYTEGYVVAAKCYFAMNDYDKASFMVEKVLSLDLNNCEALVLKTKIYAQNEQFDKALETAKMLLKYRPDVDEYYALNADLYLRRGDSATAIIYYKEAIDINPKNSSYFYAIAQIFESCDNIKEAIRYYYMAHALEPNNQDILLRLADSYVKDKKYKVAMKLLKSNLPSDNRLEDNNIVSVKVKEIDDLFKNSTNVVQYQLWHVLGI